ERPRQSNVGKRELLTGDASNAYPFRLCAAIRSCARTAKQGGCEKPKKGKARSGCPLPRVPVVPGNLSRLINTAGGGNPKCRILTKEPGRRLLRCQPRRRTGRLGDR